MHLLATVTAVSVGMSLRTISAFEQEGYGKGYLYASFESWCGICFQRLVDDGLFENLNSLLPDYVTS